MTRTGLKGKTLSSLRWTAIAKFGSQLVSWAITLIVIRLLVPADYGLMAMANVSVSLVAVVAELGFGAALVQAPRWEERRASQLLGASLIVNAMLSIALVAVAPLIGSVFDESRVVSVIQVVALQFIIGASALVPDALLRRSMRFKELSVIEVTTGIFGNAVTLVLAYSGKGVWALVLGAVAATFARALLLHIVVSDRVLPTFRLSESRASVMFGANLTLTRLVNYCFSQCDVFIVAKVLGKEALGLYSVAMHLATLPVQRVGSIVNDVAFTAFAKIQDDRKAVAANVLLAIRLISLAAFPALWGLACTAPDIVRLALGEQWMAAVLPLQIIAFAVPLRMIGTIVSTTTTSVGRVDIVLATTLVGAILAPPVFYFAAGAGIVAVSVAWALITPVMLGLNLFRATPNLGITVAEVARELLRPALAAAVMSGVVLGTNLALDQVSPLLRLAASIGAGVVAYLLATASINRHAALEALGLLWPGRFRTGAR